MKSLISVVILVCFTASLITAKGRRCIPGYLPYGRSCYWFSTVKGSFWVARSVCEHKGSHLAVITDRNEDAFVRGYAKQRGKANFYFIGATDLGLEGLWRWEGGKPWAYTNWGGNNPNNFKNNEHCLTLWNEVGYKWNDMHCDANVNFICEQEL